MTAVRTHSTRRLLEVSAVVYLVLAIALGVHFAFYLVVAAAVVALWAALCSRFPIVGYLTYRFFLGFFGGLISGLLGTRGGYYGYGYGARRYRRR